MAGVFAICLSFQWDLRFATLSHLCDRMLSKRSVLEAPAKRKKQIHEDVAYATQEQK
jgi:hypothetical protein